VMFETFLLRIYYLKDLDNVDCKTCLFILMQSRDNDYERDALLRCMIAMMVQHKDEGFHTRPKWCI
jgi:hypothetical protein